jgi:hypothetical protein
VRQTFWKGFGADSRQEVRGIASSSWPATALSAAPVPVEVSHVGANAQRAARGPVAKSPSAELREHGYELDRGFGQAVARPLAGSRVLAGEQSQLDESLEPVSENI